MTEFFTEGVIPLLGMLMSFGLVIAIVIIVTRSRQRRVEIQADLQSKLIEKFSSATELVTFLQSPAGKQFVNGVQIGNRTMVRDRVAAGYSRAIILSFLGAAFVVMWLITDHNGLAWPGVLLLALGLGNLVATLTASRMAASSDLAVPPVPRPPSEV